MDIEKVKVGPNQSAPQLNADDQNFAADMPLEMDGTSPEQEGQMPPMGPPDGQGAPPQEMAMMGMPSGDGSGPDLGGMGMPTPGNNPTHAVQLLQEVPPITLGTAEQVAAHANQKIISNDILSNAASGTTPQERVTQLSQATQAHAQEQMAAQTGQTQLEQIKQSWLEADLAFQQHLSQMPQIPEPVKAELSDPQKVFAILAGLLSGSFGDAANILNATQKQVQMKADHENQLQRQQYQDEMGQWKQEGADLRGEMGDARSMAHQESQDDLAQQRMQQADDHAEMAHEERSQRTSMSKAAEFHRQIEHYRSYESNLPEFTEENLKAREQFIRAMVQEYGDLGVTEEDVRDALGAPRRPGDRSVRQQGADLGTARAKDNRDAAKLKRMHEAYRTIVMQLSGLQGGITKAHIAALQDWIDENVPEAYRHEFLLPGVGERYQAFLGRMKAANGGSSSSRRRRRR